MRVFSLRTITTASALVFLHISASAWDFTFGYQNVFDANADLYVVGQQNVRKYLEWQTPPATYWGPSANDVEGRLTLRFDFPAPTAAIFLKAETLASNYGSRGDYGYSSLWGSKDGASWQLLQDNPIPSASAVSSDMFYNQLLPSVLAGGNSIWLQVRMQEHGALPNAQPLTTTWADAQFSRYEQNPANLFELDVTLVPEPGVLTMLCLGLAVVLVQRRGK